MSIVHHPDITTLMAFSAGTLDEPYAVVISVHLAMCEACRAVVRRTDLIGGALLADEPPAALSAKALDRLLAATTDDPVPAPRLTPAAHDVPGPLARHLPGGLQSVQWKFAGPGASTCNLPSSKSARSRLLLLRVGAGRRVPEHGHGGHELTLILTGAYKDRFGTFGAGDLADHDEDVEHQPIAEPGEDCVCLVAVDARLTFRSRLIRTLQPLFGL